MYCGCRTFLKNKLSAHRHRKTCKEGPAIRDKKAVTEELVFEMANLKLDKIQGDFKNDWFARFGTLDNFPLK